MLDHNARNCLSNWFGRLVATGIPVPRTEIVRTDIDLSPLCEGEGPEGFAGFLDELQAARSRIGGDVFLRTGQGSGKHQFKDTCFLPVGASLIHHVYALVEWSACVDFMGLPTDVWVCREMLPVEPVAILDRYGGFPLVREVRLFVNEGKIVCQHSYWPNGAIQQGFRVVPADIAEIIASSQVFSIASLQEIGSLASRVAQVFAGDGAWSVDILETKRGYFVTDMADAGMSYHEPTCPHAREFRDAR